MRVKCIATRTRGISSASLAGAEVGGVRLTEVLRIAFFHCDQVMSGKLYWTVLN
jgi:hypothetical protein